MKSYTDIEESKKLAEILPIETADMFWADGERPAVWNNKDISLDDTDIPAWSLAALLDVYPMVVGKDLDMYCCWQNSKNLCSKHYDNPVDAVVELIFKLHEEKLL